MAEFSDLSDFLSCSMTSNNSQTLWVRKNSRASGVGAAAPTAGSFVSYWQYDGTVGAGAIPPTTAENPINETTGSFKLRFMNSTQQMWVAATHFTSDQPGSLYIYDRLMHISGLVANVTTNQLVSGSVTRYTGSYSAGNEIWVEIYSQIGTGVTTITANYVNQDGVDKVSNSAEIGGSGRREVQRAIKIPLATGDTGVRRVDSVKLNATTTSVGNFGIIIAHPITRIDGYATNYGSVRSFIDGEFPEILSGACINAFYHCAGTATPHMLMYMNVVNK